MAFTFNCNRFWLIVRADSSCVDMSPYTVHDNYALCIMNYALTNYQVVIAAGSHLFPFRTEKLSPPAPMVLQCNAGE